ncbi:hypothetical protein EDD16DRAFT_1532477 [Pisolithus croceorrhizus]|nr:hypothetical protein EV401DRAFT_277958 [Pisolithus croceorrhizus]KAI6132504.1 hypothetical protein EDD16DRAFT_1532477 [Pisolithus croceorrhizus]
MTGNTLLATLRWRVSTRAPQSMQSTVLARTIHHSSTFHQRKKDDGLFSKDASPPKASSATVPSHSDGVKLRERQFSDLVQFVADRTGRKPVNTKGQVRQSAWLRLFQLAWKPEHLELVSEMFPRWRDTGKSFRPVHAEMFARRCEELKCPLLALKVFGDHSKYGFGLNSLPAGRQLIHSLYGKYPLEKTMTAASLYGLYGLPAVGNDFVSCAMLYAACVRSRDPHAQVVAESLKHQLTKQTAQAEEVKEPKDRILRAQHNMKPTLWLAQAIRQIKTAHGEQGLPSTSFLGMWNTTTKPRKPRFWQIASQTPSSDGATAKLVESLS